jgi:hypothetical protein
MVPGMRRAAVLALTVALAAGCDDGGASPAPTGTAARSMLSGVDGSWVVELSSACAGAMTFDARSYVDQLICHLADGSFGTEVTAGYADFSQAGQVRMTPQRSSCPAHAAGPVVASLSVQGDHLTLGGPSGATVFERLPSSGGGSAVVRFGCWSMGKFQAQAIQDL